MSEALCQEERLQLIAERRKWQTEIENKKRQLEDDRRALQHLKSKVLRERWLLDGPPCAGPEHDEVKRQLEQDETRTRTLEDTINRLEQELVGLEDGAMCQPTTHIAVSSGSVKAVEVNGHSNHHQNRGQEVKAFAEIPCALKPRKDRKEMRRAMYSVEIKVERDRLTGETKVLSTNTMLPVDFSQKGIKVYEDEQKVVHEMNGEDGIHQLSSIEVDELIHKADEASMTSQKTVATVTSLPTAEVQEEEEEAVPQIAVEITGLETKAGGGESSVAEASTQNPVTMVFMGYQSVEDEEETKKVLGPQGTVKAELVLIHDPDGKLSPSGEGKKKAGGIQTIEPSASPPNATCRLPSSEAPETTAEEEEVKKEKQPCKCCSIM
ncbi:paralemmin 1a isoform X2 [Betta splendens]|nr:paralemmin 1a isoform X2 [Betta splendens]XP_029001880.1 paralemmin 1a isoform X2 [Betta splendens]